MGRNHLFGSRGDAINAVLAAVGYNFRLLLQWLARFCAPSSGRSSQPGQAAHHNLSSPE